VAKSNDGEGFFGLSRSSTNRRH